MPIPWMKIQKYYQSQNLTEIPMTAVTALFICLEFGIFSCSTLNCLVWLYAPLLLYLKMNHSLSSSTLLLRMWLYLALLTVSSALKSQVEENSDIQKEFGCFWIWAFNLCRISLEKGWTRYSVINIFNLLILN